MNQHVLWERVHAALDERRDPLADPGVLAELERSPESLAEVHALVEGLATLDGIAGAPPGDATQSDAVARPAAPRRAMTSEGDGTRVPRLAVRRALALVAAAAAGIVLWFGLRERSRPDDSAPTPSLALAVPAAATTVAPPARSRVLDWSVRFEHRTGDERALLVATGSAGEQVRELRVELRPEHRGAHPALPLTTIVVRNQVRNQP